MSKSLGNYIAIDEPPHDMYGKVMSVPDSLIMDYFELLTNVDDEEILEFKEKLASQSVNPMELKKRLAREIVAQFHDQKAAQEAEAQFERVVQRQEVPEDIKEYPIPIGRYKADFYDPTRDWGNTDLETLSRAAIVTENGIVSFQAPALLVMTGLAESRSEAKRLIKQGAIKVDGITLKESDFFIQTKDGCILQRGNRRFVKIVDADKGKPA
jgi:tyrosyl-tRNA synthetase